MKQQIFITSITVGMLTALLFGCTPTVRVAAPEKPITINLNVKVQQEVRVRVERDVDKAFDKKDGIF